MARSSAAIWRRITLGPRVNIQDGCIIHTDHGDPQLIEEGVVVGHRAVLHGRRIGRDTLIGMGALLLAGCEIGEECVIAAGTLVTEGRRIPPRSVVMGVPGKVVREITAEELERTRRIAAGYLELAQRVCAERFRRRGALDRRGRSSPSGRVRVRAIIPALVFRRFVGSRGVQGRTAGVGQVQEPTRLPLLLVTKNKKGTQLISGNELRPLFLFFFFQLLRK